MEIRNELHNKLVRDRIPEILERMGAEVKTEIISDAPEYDRALRQKLIEEAQEAAEVQEGHLLEELGDVLSVIDAIRAQHGISAEQLAAQQKKKDDERGTFKGRIKLISTKEKNG